ncbi:MAG: Rrf2 family transcriptional regulator [Lachnospiraceae bacterium]
MLITKECDYAVRIIRALASGNKVNVTEISRREDIPTQFTYKISRKLEKINILRSVRGVNGGYILNRSLESLTLYDICEAVNKEILLTNCMEESYHCTRNLKGVPCLVHEEFIRIQELLVQELKANSLLSILNK